MIFFRKIILVYVQFGFFRDIIKVLEQCGEDRVEVLEYSDNQYQMKQISCVVDIDINLQLLYFELRVYYM